jgi:cytochrome c553
VTSFLSPIPAFAAAAALALVFLPGLQAAETAPAKATGPQGKELFAEICAACHGPKGEGKIDLKTPSIGSMPAWYVTRQLGKFQNDIRGANTKDTTGVQMSAIAHALNPGQIKSVAAYIQSLPISPTRSTLKGDLDDGKLTFAEICMGCHRYNASGEMVFGSPPLTGLQDWYILAQLKKFSKGIRGAHEEDEHGAKMHQVAGYLTEDQMKNVASYIAIVADKYVEPPPPKKKR